MFRVAQTGYRSAQERWGYFAVVELRRYCFLIGGNAPMRNAHYPFYIRGVSKYRPDLIR